MANIENLLWPYDEVEITQDEKGVHYKSPWVTVSFPQKIADSVFHRLIEIRKNGPQNKEEILLMDSLLRPVKKYPIYYCLPNLQKNADTHLKKFSFTTGEALRWDAESVLSMSQIQKDLYDGVSTLMCFRLKHLQDLNRYLATVPKDLTLQNFENSSLREAALLYLRQNHYVTQRCEGVLEPAIHLHPACTAKVKEFIREEQGHDKLLALSFKELGVTEDSIRVLPSLIRLMDFFAEVAKTNLLGFCFIIDMFERSPESDKNPMVLALLKMGEVKAAKPIQAHSNINVHGGHDNESVEILEPLGALPKSYVMQGLLLAQKASDLMIAFLQDRNEQLQAIKTFQ